MLPLPTAHGHGYKPSFWPRRVARLPLVRATRPSPSLSGSALGRAPPERHRRPRAHDEARTRARGEVLRVRSPAPRSRSSAGRGTRARVVAVLDHEGGAVRGPASRRSGLRTLARSLPSAGSWSAARKSRPAPGGDQRGLTSPRRRAACTAGTSRRSPCPGSSLDLHPGQRMDATVREHAIRPCVARASVGDKRRIRCFVSCHRPATVACAWPLETSPGDEAAHSNRRKSRTEADARRPPHPAR